jgi:hypothetical protein
LVRAVLAHTIPPATTHPSNGLLLAAILPALLAARASPPIAPPLALTSIAPNASPDRTPFSPPARLHAQSSNPKMPEPSHGSALM